MSKHDICKVTTTTGRSGNISPARLKIEALMADSPKAMTVREIADAAGCDFDTAQRHAKTLEQVGQLRNVTTARHRAVYLHRKFVEVERRESVELHINGNQPNGDIGYWKKHMAWQNTPARVELLA